MQEFWHEIALVCKPQRDDQNYVNSLFIALPMVPRISNMLEIIGQDSHSRGQICLSEWLRTKFSRCDTLSSQMQQQPTSLRDVGLLDYFHSFQAIRNMSQDGGINNITVCCIKGTWWHDGVEEKRERKDYACSHVILL